MYSATEYRRVRVVFLARDFPDASCRIDFVRRRTLDEGLNRGFNRKVDRRCMVVALIVVTALGSTLHHVRVRRNISLQVTILRALSSSE